MKNKQKLSDSEQFKIVDTFILHNMKEEKVRINYKMTSQMWAALIGKWAGVEISPLVVNDVCKEYSVESKEIARNIFVFALELKK